MFTCTLSKFFELDNKVCFLKVVRSGKRSSLIKEPIYNSFEDWNIRDVISFDTNSKKYCKNNINFFDRDDDREMFVLFVKNPSKDIERIYNKYGYGGYIDIEFEEVQSKNLEVYVSEISVEYNEENEELFEAEMIDFLESSDKISDFVKNTKNTKIIKIIHEINSEDFSKSEILELIREIRNKFVNV